MTKLLPAVVFGMMLCVFTSMYAAEPKVAVKDQEPLDYWTLTRSSNAVVKAAVITASKTVKLEVTDVLKGQGVPAVIEFPAPAVAKTIPGKIELKFIIIEKLQFPAGKVIIVFLKKTESGGYEPVRTAVYGLEAVEQCVGDVLRFDAMTGDDRDKCKMLVDLAISREGFSSGNALQELNKYNRPEFLELLSPLGDKPHIQMHYARLLATNENPATTDILLDLLRNPESDNNLPTLFECLQRKNPGDAEISKEILRYITNDSPRVRSTAIFVANYRGAIPALAEVLACLNDQSPEVRSMALYCFQGVDDPQVRAKIWELIHDPEDRVRENAYRALPLTNSTFYRFLTVSFLDRSRQVRRATDRLDLFWERSPVVISLMLLWPSMIAAAFAVIASGGNRRVLIVVTGIAAGYIAGLAAGYLTGRFYVGNPLFNAVILVPPFFIPFGLVLVGAVYRFGKKISLVLFPLIAASVCLTLSLVTWNNTLWLCVLAGFVILELVILLCPSKSYQSTIPARP